MPQSELRIEISPKVLYQQLRNGYRPLLLDVRGIQKHKEWTIFDSLNIPIMTLLSTKKEELPPEFQSQEIITVCGSGNDSKIAAKDLQKKGLNALSLEGGLTLWNSIFDHEEVLRNDGVKMIQFRRIAKGCLSYMLIGKDEALVIDPAFNLDPYLEYSRTNDLTITKVIDTHLHADHVSGAINLAEKCDASLFLSSQDPYEFKSIEYTPIKHNDKFQLNGTYLKSLHTPGHTFGSYSFSIDGYGILSGDTIFADGVGRPDLANKAREFASDLYRSMTLYKSLSQDMFIAPAHHGKFTLEHFNKPLLTDVRTFIQNPIVDKTENEFIEYAVNRVETLPHPPSYQKIRNINAGKTILAPNQINDLEIGPNRCAMN